MIRFYVFGPPDLRMADGSVLEAMPSQPKRAAILAYLAIARPRGFHRRDTLLGLFWPELDESRARDALNTAVSYLRRSLGAGAVVSRGASELGLAPDQLWCDVWAFEEALRTDRLADALELYRGDLLTGFFVSGVIEFDHWLESERSRLRKQAHEAAWTLAARAEAEEDFEAAVRWARRGTEIIPGDEAALRRLIGLLDRLGDDAGALRAYDEFARWLRETQEAEPSQTTRTLIDEIRSRASVAPTEPARSAPAAAASAVRPRAPAAPRASPSPPMTPPPPVPGPVGRAERAVVDRGRRGSGGRWRRRAGLAALLGAVVIGGMIWRATADSPAGSGRPVLATPHIAYERLGTGSIEALDAFRAGEVAVEHGRYEAAVEAFERAIEADSSFALAYLKLSMAANWVGDHPLDNWAADQAVRRADRLDTLKRSPARAWWAYLQGDPRRAERLIETALPRNMDVDALYVLAEVRFHWMPTLGESATRSRSAWEHVLAFRQDDPRALVHLARIAATEGDDAELRALARRFLRLDPPLQQALDARALTAFATGDRAEQRRTLAEFSGEDAASIESAARLVAAHAGDLVGAAELARLLTTADREQPARALGAALLAQFEAARGRGRAAVAQLAIDALPSTRALEFRAAFLAVPFLAVPVGTATALRRAIARTPDDAFIGPGREFLVHDGIYPPRRLYLLGWLSLLEGDRDAAERQAATLERAAGRTDMDDAFLAYYARLLRAEISRARGDPEAALALLGEPSAPSDSVLPMLLDYPKARERWLRAELHRELGHHDEALRWYATFPDPNAYDLIYLAPSHLRRAELYEQSGEAEEAARHYERVIALWQDADRPLQPMAEKARAALARLRGRE